MSDERRQVIERALQEADDEHRAAGTHVVVALPGVADLIERVLVAWESQNVERTLVEWESQNPAEVWPAHVEVYVEGQGHRLYTAQRSTPRPSPMVPEKKPRKT